MCRPATSERVRQMVGRANQYSEYNSEATPDSDTPLRNMNYSGTGTVSL